MALLLLLAANVLSVIAPIVVPAGTSTLSVDINVAAAREQILAAARDRGTEIFLDLDEIEAARPPDVYFEIYVHAKTAPRERSVGNLALFGAGVRSESPGAFRPGHVRLPITESIVAALRTSSTISITFVAQGAGGTRTPARSSSSLTIGKPAIIDAPRSRE
jgi:hypothetical protein